MRCSGRTGVPADVRRSSRGLDRLQGGVYAGVYGSESGGQGGKWEVAGLGKVAFCAAAGVDGGGGVGGGGDGLEGVLVGEGMGHGGGIEYGEGL